MAASTAVVAERARGVRQRWFADAIIGGFVAIGTSTAVLMVVFGLSNGLADPRADVARQWLYQLTHNDVVAFSSGRPAIAIALHVLLGLVWALIYARFVEFRLSGPGWRKGLIFSLLPWLFSLLILLPAAVVNMLEWAFSAGPLVPIGNLILHLIYGFTLGQLYDSSADAPALGDDAIVNEPLSRAAVEHSEDLGAAGILAGAVVGALVGVMLAVLLPPTISTVDFGGWEIALGIGGVLAGGAVGGIVGSFAGLPQLAAGEVTGDEVDGTDLDPFTYRVIPFLLPPLLLAIIIAIVVTIGQTLLHAHDEEIHIGDFSIQLTVLGATLAVFAIGIGAWLLALRPEPQPSPSSRDTVSHSAEH